MTTHARPAIVALPREERALKISDLSWKFTVWFRSRGASPKTIESYDLAVRQYIAFLAEQGRVNDLKSFTPETVDAFATYLAEHGRKASSVNVKLAALHSLANYARKVKDDRGRWIMDENPLDRVFRPKRVRAAEKYLTVPELRRLLAVGCEPEERLALRMLVDTGLRVSEVSSARVKDLREEDGRLLLAVTVKGGRARTVRLGEDVGASLRAALLAREAAAEAPLLVTPRGERYTRTGLSELVLRLAGKAGLTRFPVRAHVLRHSVATIAIAEGCDIPTVAGMLNHSDLATVSRYIHREDAVDQARDAVRRALDAGRDTSST